MRDVSDGVRALERPDCQSVCHSSITIRHKVSWAQMTAFFLTRLDVIDKVSLVDLPISAAMEESPEEELLDLFTSHRSESHLKHAC